MKVLKYRFRKAGSNNQSCLIATYENGGLKSIEVIGSPIELWEAGAIRSNVPLKVEALEHWENESVTVEQITLSSAGEKLALFCAEYKKRFGVNYLVEAGDPTRICFKDMTPRLLKLYFDNKLWWGKQPKSIQNYDYQYNALLQLASGKNPTPRGSGGKFPNHWSKEYEKKLNGKRLVEYWRHLRCLGLKPLKSDSGVVFKWVDELEKSKQTLFEGESS